MQFLWIQKSLCPVAWINKTGSRQSTTALSKKRENAVATLILQGENMPRKILVVWHANYDDHLREFAEEEQQEAIRCVRDLIFEDRVHPSEISVYFAEPTNFGVQVGGLHL